MMNVNVIKKTGIFLFAIGALMMVASVLTFAHTANDIGYWIGLVVCQMGMLAWILSQPRKSIK